MASFVVMTPPLRNGQRDKDRMVFVRDGFTWLAFIFPVPWLLVQRLWLEAALVFGATIAISLVGRTSGHEDVAAIVTALLSLLIGLEAGRWRYAMLERKGFEQCAVVVAANAADAEITYFYGSEVVSMQAEEPAVRTALPLRPLSPMPALGGMVGLVSHRGEN